MIGLLTLSTSAFSEVIPETDAQVRRVPYSRGILEGKLPVSFIRKDILATVPKFRSCWQKELSRDVGAKGSVTLKFIITQSGLPAKAEVLGDISSDFKLCLLEQVFAMEFTPYRDEGIIEVRQPLNFKPIKI